MEGTKKVSSVLASLVVLLCIAAVAPAGKNPGGSGAGTLIGARFSTDTRISSDGNFVNLCPPVDAEYVDNTATCTNMATPNAEQASISRLATGSLYFLRTIPVCCDSATSPSTSDWEYYAVHPSRWLVLDFSGFVSPSTCPSPSIDTQIAINVAGITWSPLPTPTPPTGAGGCVSPVVVRFSASQAFSPGATSTSLTILIDHPELQFSRTGAPARIYWDGLYSLHFQQPVQITNRNATTGALTLTTTGSSSDLADLLDANNSLVGTYHMPFSVRLTPVQ